MIFRQFRDESFAIIANGHCVIGRNNRHRRRYRRKINRPERTTPSLAFVELPKTGEECRFRKPLHLQVERGKHLESPFVDHRLAVLRNQQLPDILHKIRGELVTARTLESEWL